MFVHIKVKPNSSKVSVESFGGDRYLVYLTEPPENDRANIQMLNVISKHLGIPAGRIKIKTGWHNDDKMLEIK